MTTPGNIGRYEIISEIGHGAMGVVYLAHDPRIDRRVALKTIHALHVLPDLEAEEIKQRFTREAQAAGRLQHPGIVTIFDVGEDEGTWFIAMEYIEGETLERYARKDKLLPLPKVIGLIVQACEALDYAHQQRIVHRDIKPANLMLLKNGRLKITDFGLAKNPTTNLTQEGILIGTPNYMSPEQVMGRTLDGRSDLFSLAAVFYELLTGERPFPGDTVTTIIYRILNEQPPAPIVSNKEIPEFVAQVLVKALAKEPERRYQTGAELAAALQDQGEELLAEGVGVTRPMRVVARPVPSKLSAGAVPVAAPSARPGMAPARPARPEPAPAMARAVAAPRQAAWMHPVRVGFILLGTLALVLLIPTAGTLDDRWGRPDAAGAQPFYRTAGILIAGAGGAGPPTTPGGSVPSEATLAPPAVALPGGSDAIAITWQTSPPGGKIYIDDVETPNGVMHVSKKETAAHTIVAESDCFIEKVSWRAGQDADGAVHSIPLKTPKIVAASVTTRPPGAKVLLDGKDTGKVTPADIPVPACGTHAVSLRLEGYRELETKLEKPGAPLSLTLAKLPVGFVKISAPYPVSIFENGKELGQSGAQIKLSGGAHKLVLKNEDLFVERTINVTVQADKVLAPDAGLPGVGTLTVLASPSNCTISLNGRDLGPPPINDLRLAAGAYTIKAVYVPTGEAKETSVTITAGGGTRVPFKFSP